MPVPKPRPNELEKDFIGRCIKTMKKTDPSRSDDQIKAICFNTWRKDKGLQKQEYELKDGRLVPKDAA